MKKSIFIICVLFIFFSCQESSKENKSLENENVIEQTAFNSYGEKIDDKNVISENELAVRYAGLKLGDTIDVKFKSKVKEVCQNKGCWMKLGIGETETMVKFKDYGFFMPMDIAGEEVIVSGKAFVEEVSVEEQRHYAEDAGKTQAEIAKITDPKKTLSFLSNGVLIAKNK